MPAASAVVAQVVMDSYATTTIISNINSLYNNIFTFVAVLVTLGGIAFPIALTRYQNKKLKNNQKELTDLINSKIVAAQDALVGSIKKDLATDFESLEKNISEIKAELIENINEKSAGVNAKAHQSQGNKKKAEGRYASALVDYLIAASDYVKSKDELNMKRVVRLIIETLPKLKQPDFENDEEHNDLEKRFNKTIERIETLNVNGRYLEEIKSMKAKLKEAKVRN